MRPNKVKHTPIMWALFMGIVLIVAQYLLDVNDFGTGVPRYAAPHQVPLGALTDGHALQRWKSRDRHHYGAPVLQVHLKLPPFGERQPLNFGLYVPITFCLVHTLFRFLDLDHPDGLALCCVYPHGRAP